MRKEERLFAALSGVDEELLARSERKKSGGRRWIAWGAALAACLALAAVLGPWIAPETVGPDVPPDAPSAEDVLPVPDEGQCTLPWYPDKPEKLRYLQIAPQERDIPEFTLWINEESYYTYEQGGVYVIKPLNPPQVPDGELPECKMEIEYLPGDLADAVETVRSRLKNFYQDVSEENQDAHSSMGIGWLPGAEHYFRGTNGTDWNSAQQETWLLPCYEDGGQTGVFALSASYFLEAEEGHGTRFRAMIQNFQIWPDAAAQPYPWMRALEDTALRLTKAVMSDDLSGVEDLLAPGAEVFGPGEDVYAYVSISSIHCDYTVWSGYKENHDEVPESAVVSVQYRLGGEDSYCYLTMEVLYQDGRWVAEWIGIEK